MIFNLRYVVAQKSDEVRTLVFDVNVVPPSDNDLDYEEVFKQQKDAEGGVEELVNGKPSEKGYYVDENAKTDSRSHAKYPWRE